MLCTLFVILILTTLFLILFEKNQIHSDPKSFEFGFFLNLKIFKYCINRPWTDCLMS